MDLMQVFRTRSRIRRQILLTPTRFKLSFTRYRPITHRAVEISCRTDVLATRYIQTHAKVTEPRSEHNMKSRASTGAPALTITTGPFISMNKTTQVLSAHSLRRICHREQLHLINHGYQVR